MASASFLMIFWSLYVLMLGIVEILAAHWLHRASRSGATVWMVAGAWAAGLLNASGRLYWWVVGVFGWEIWSNSIAFKIIQWLSMAGACGNLVFFCGLLWYARKRLGENNRIAELEAILQDQGRG